MAGQLLAPPCANEARPRQPQRLPRACTVVCITNRISVAFCRQHAPAGWRNACWYLQRASVTRNVRRERERERGGGAHVVRNDTVRLDVEGIRPAIAFDKHLNPCPAHRHTRPLAAAAGGNAPSQSSRSCSNCCAWLMNLRARGVSQRWAASVPVQQRWAASVPVQVPTRRSRSC